MKTNAIIRIILFSLVILLLGSILGVALLGDLFVFRHESHHETSSELPLASDNSSTQSAVDASKVREIEIAWAAGSITIQPVEKMDQITIQESGNVTDPMYVVMDGDTLEIRFWERELKFSSIDIEAKDLVINVPAGWICESLNIDAAAAKVYVHDLTINEVDFDGASGECIFNDCIVKDYDVDTASGNIHFKGHVERFDCDAASADCILELCNTPSSIQLDSLSGDLELILPADSGFSCEIDKMSGSFESDFECKRTGNTHTHGNGACRIIVSALSGDVNIRKNHETEHCNH